MVVLNNRRRLRGIPMSSANGLVSLNGQDFGHGTAGRHSDIIGVNVAQSTSTDDIAMINLGESVKEQEVYS